MDELERGFELSIQPTQFVLQPRRWRMERRSSATTDSTVRQLVIKRRSRTRDISLVSGVTPLTEKEVNVHVYGILGVYTMLSDDYLGVVIGATKIGSVKKQLVYRVTKTVLLPFDGDAAKALATAQAYWKSSETVGAVEKAVQASDSRVDPLLFRKGPESILLKLAGGSSSLVSSPAPKASGANSVGGPARPLVLGRGQPIPYSLTGSPVPGSSSSSSASSSSTTLAPAPAAPGATAIGGGMPIIIGAGMPIGTVLGSSSSKKPASMFDSQTSFQAVDEKAVIDMTRFFDTGGFFFSYGYDLTNCLQRQPYGSNPIKLRIDKVLDPRFWWNATSLSEFVSKNLQKYMLPVIQGFVSIEICEMASEKFDFIVISRRSRFRAGLRYERRGIDVDGNVANMVETEQMIVYQGQHASFVQLRGSIPLYWTQPANRLRPVPELKESEAANTTAMHRHFSDLLGKYGPQIIVNLINQSGREAIVGTAFKNYLQKLPFNDIKYTAFDFHEMCKGFRYENVSLLVKELQDTFNTMMYCWESSPVPPMTRRERETIDMIQQAETAAILAQSKGVEAARLIKPSIIPPAAKSAAAAANASPNPPLTTSTAPPPPPASPEKASPMVQRRDSTKSSMLNAASASIGATFASFRFRAATTTTATTTTTVAPTATEGADKPFVPGHRRSASTNSPDVFNKSSTPPPPPSANIVASLSLHDVPPSELAEAASVPGSEPFPAPTHGGPSGGGHSRSVSLTSGDAAAAAAAVAATDDIIATTRDDSALMPPPSSRPRSNTNTDTNAVRSSKLEVFRFIEQKGTFRVNCMDCLDRTNVIQSALARQMINVMLTKMGVQANPGEGIKFYREFDTVFNNVWANNGDEISKGYAGTGALKSDFTRTGKRTRTGAMTDGVNSLTRLYKNNFKDGYRQIVIDFLLGYQTAEAFLQHMTTAPLVDMEPVKKLHDDAVRNCRDMIIPNSEHMTYGWVLYYEPKHEEWPPVHQDRVLLLTRFAYYLVNYDFTQDKVISFDRVDFGDIQGINFGIHPVRKARTTQGSPVVRGSTVSPPTVEIHAASPVESKSEPASRSTSPDPTTSVSRGNHMRESSDGGASFESNTAPTPPLQTDINYSDPTTFYCVKINYRSRQVRYSKDTTSLWANPLLQADSPLVDPSAGKLREIDQKHDKPGFHFLSVRPRSSAAADHFEQSHKDQEGNLQAVVAALKHLCPQVKFNQFL